jgi:hypothetical protein
MTITETLGVWGYIVGVCGFVMALSHVCWQIWWQLRQNKERVRAEFLEGPEPCVRVHNIGAIDVHVTGVDLVVECGRKTEKYVLQAPAIHRAIPQAAGGLGNEIWQYVGDRSYGEPVQRGAAQVFGLPTGAAPLSELLANPKNLRVYISVYSNAGEIFRLGKKNTLAYLTAVATQEPAHAS